MLKNYLKIALRNLVKYKGYSFINVFGLAIGISLCLLILIYVRHQLSYDQFHEKKDRIVRVHLEDEDGQIAVTPSIVAPSLGFISPDVEHWVRLYEPTRYAPVTISTEVDRFQEDSFMHADSSFFDIFSFQFIAGNPKTALVRPGTVVLTRSTSEKLFGTTQVVGKTINARIFNSDIDFEVTGVMEDVPGNSHFSFDYLASLTTFRNWSQLSDTEIRSANFYTYLLLTSSEVIPGLEGTVADFVEENVPEERASALPLLPLTDIYFNSEVDMDIRPGGNLNNVYGFSFLAFLVLLIGTINYINLATARASRRGSEVGIRKALGAARSQLIKQFYGESIILTLVSVIAAVILVEVFKEQFFSLMGEELSFNLLGDTNALLMLVGVTIFTSVLAGSYPALLLSSFQPVKVLKGLITEKGSDGKLRKGLVISQFAISTFLILSTVIIFQQTNFILTSDLGFNKEEIIVVPARDSELRDKQDLLKSEITRQTGVVNATYMSNIPGRVFGGYSSIHTPGSKSVSTNAGAADPNLVNTLEIDLLAGEGFPTSPGYTKEQGYVYLLNETLAKAHGWEPDEAIGKTFNVLGNREGEVVGVMKDFNFASLREDVEPLALFIDPGMYNFLLIKLSPENMRENLASLERVWNEIAPHRPFEFEFMDQQLSSLYESEVRTRNLLSLFSMLAILIACLGLIGLSSFLIERRSKEIGIRKVLGASVSNIVTLLSTDFLKLVGIGFIVGAPVAWYIMDKWLTNFAFRIDIGVGVFLLVALIASIIALLTVSLQSIKAAISNPVDSLKSE